MLFHCDALQPCCTRKPLSFQAAVKSTSQSLRSDLMNPRLRAWHGGGQQQATALQDVAIDEKGYIYVLHYNS